MTPKDKKSLAFSLETDDELANRPPDDMPLPPAAQQARKNMRRINPLGMRVVVKLRPESNVTDSGLYLPEGAKQAMAESMLAEVVEVAMAMDDDTHEEANISGIPLGALVLIAKGAGVRVPWDERLRIVETKEVLAVVHELRVT